MSKREPEIRTLLYKQDKFIYSEAKFPAIVGTWGCGKSLAGLYAADKECLENPGTLYLIIRKEFVDLRDSTMQDWSSMIGRPWNGDKNVTYSNGSVLMFRHGKDIDSLKNTNLGGALIIQAEEMTEEEFWFIVGRLRRKQGTLKLRIEANYNGHNWIYKLWKKKDINIPPGSSLTLADFDLIETNTLDNRANLPESYIASLEALPERLKRRHYLGSWDEAQGLVYDEYSENRHDIKPIIIPEDWEQGFIVDHGFTNPTAVLWYAIDYDGNIYLWSEHYEREKGVSYHANEIKKRGLYSGYCDPALFSKNQSRGDYIYSIADEYRDFGINLISAQRSAEAASIARVNEMFKAGKIRVFNTLRNFKDEIANWKWRVSNARIATNSPEEPEDKDNHLMDCLKYLIASRFGAPVKEEPKLAQGTAGHIMARIEAERVAKTMHSYKRVAA